MKKIIIGVLVIIEIFSLYMMYQSNENKNLNEVKVNENNNNQFAIKYEKEIGEYEEYIGNEFPKGYILNKEQSKCIDEEGNIIENSLEYNNNQITFTSTNTNYCYLTFSKSAGLKIIESKPDHLNANQAGMYRYQGSKDEVTNNYICFGTNSESDCLSNQDKYMYRIIGIDEQNYELKLIKDKPLKENQDGTEITEFPFHHSTNDLDYVNFSWDKSDIYKRLNGKSVNDTEYSNIFMDSEYYDYLKEGKWQDIISPHEMLIGTIYETEIGSPDQAYQIEQGKAIARWFEHIEFEEHITDDMECETYTTQDGKEGYVCTKYWDKKLISKILLFSISDYYYSLKENGLDCEQDHSSSEECHNGWFIDNQDYNLSIDYMGSGWSQGVHYVLGYMPNRGLGGGAVYANTLIKPVFYLVNNVNLTGNGAIDNPYIIN